MLYTFFDVETPNRRNDRICSIGAVVTDQDGTVVEKKSYLVNPESSFDDINVRIHGIAPVDVRNAKTFPELWYDSLSILPGRRRGCTQRAVRSQRLDQNTGLI